DDERALRGADLEQPPDGPVRLLDRDGARDRADDARDAVRDRTGLGPVAGGLGDRAHLGPAGEPADDLRERPVRDALAVRQAAPGDDARPVAEPVEQRAD